MRKIRALRALRLIVITIYLTAGICRLSPFSRVALAAAQEAATGSDFAVAPQYGTAHVYVEPKDFDRFVAALLATFGGRSSKPAVITVTPTPSRTMWQAVSTPSACFRSSDSRRRFRIRSAPSGQAIW